MLNYLRSPLSAFRDNFKLSNHLLLFKQSYFNFISTDIVFVLLNPFLRLKQKLTKMDPGFIIADSANLPRIDLLMMGEFLASNKDFCSAEFCNVKPFL